MKGQFDPEKNDMIAIKVGIGGRSVGCERSQRLDRTGRKREVTAKEGCQMSTFARVDEVTIMICAFTLTIGLLLFPAMVQAQDLTGPESVTKEEAPVWMDMGADEG